MIYKKRVFYIHIHISPIMGLTDSKPDRLDAEEREHRERFKSEVVLQRKAQLNTIQADVLSSSTALVTSDTVKLIRVTEKAKAQLDRGGNVLTKTDLVAVLVALQPEAKSRIEALEKLTISDLNSMIRNTIYDPARLLSSTSLTSSTSSTLTTTTTSVPSIEHEN